MASQADHSALNWLLKTPDDLTPGFGRLYVIEKTGIPFGVIMHMFFVLIFWHLGLTVLTIFNIASVVLWAVALWFFRAKREMKWTYCIGVLIEIPLHGVLATYYLGLESAFLLFILHSVVLTTLAHFIDRKLRIALSTFYALLFVAVGIAGISGLAGIPVVEISTGWKIFFFTMNGLSFAVMITVFMAMYEWVAAKAEADLKVEFDRAEMLLANILPKEIAAQLKDSPDLIAEEFPQATILFADIVGFTSTSSELSPARLVENLNKVFSRFDDLVAKHDLEKIKTIGDAYMIASGLPKPREDHAEVMVQMAQDMLVAADELDAEIVFPLKIRIGINSGPVVAGVIGHKKFAYDLWGDAVNVAARMEEHAEPGHILFTQSTRDLLGDNFAYQELAAIEVKGKGKMPVFCLVP